MKFIILFSCLLLLHIIIHDIQAQEENNFLQTICYNTTDYTTGSQYHLNLNQLLTSLISNVTRDGFFHTKIGKVEGLVQCRGGLSTEQCQICLNKSSVEIIQSCPSRKDAVLRYDYCFLRYSSTPLSQVETTSRWSYMDAYNISDAYTVLYEQQYRKLMNHLSMAAASTILRFSYGHINFTTRNNIYGMAQCTQDLSRSACFSCLQRMVPRPDCCYRRRGGRIFGTGCFIRYELHEFLNAVLESNPPETTVSPPESSSNNTQVTEKANGKGNENTIKFIVVAVPIIGSVTLIAICAFLITKRRKKEESINYDQDDIRDEKSQQYDLDMIKRATNGFSILNKLGEGGFGAVYKGHFLNGQEIAVKRLSKNSGQGSQEFKNEVVLLLKLQHRNLVKLLGYCMEGEEKLLVYEYLPNRSLDYYIFDSANKTLLDWERRYKIIGGIARGLLYLHEDSRLRIIHRDLKSGNILLDKEMNPKIADFGLAKLFGVDETEGNTNRIAGTYGYMAPEYALHGFFSVKSDVYSFGVLLLEIVSGLKTKFIHFPGSPVDLLSHAWKLWRDGNALELIDPTLVGNYSTDEILRCIHIGLLCVQDKLDDRPNMSNVVLMLTSYSLILEAPCVPTFNLESTMGNADTSSNLRSSSSTTGSLLHNLI